jgi:hypothetical protein
MPVLMCDTRGDNECWRTPTRAEGAVGTHDVPHAVGKGPRGEVGDQPSCTVEFSRQGSNLEKGTSVGFSLVNTERGVLYSYNTMWRVSQD